MYIYIYIYLNAQLHRSHTQAMDRHFVHLVHCERGAELRVAGCGRGQAACSVPSGRDATCAGLSALSGQGSPGGPRPGGWVAWSSMRAASSYGSARQWTPRPMWVVAGWRVPGARRSIWRSDRSGPAGGGGWWTLLCQAQRGRSGARRAAQYAVYASCASAR